MSTLAQVNRALNEIDDGPAVCALESTDKSNPLPYVNNHDALCAELLALRDAVALLSTQNPQFKEDAASTSVAAWIFHSNKLEYASQETEGDTKDLIRTNSARHGDEAEQATLRTFHLLCDTFCNPYQTQAPAKVAFDIPNLKQWHLSLFPMSTGSFGGRFRVATAFAEGVLEKTVHVYPHHGIIKSAIEQLGFIVYQQLKCLSKTDDPIRKLAHAFAVASFAHFHFLDIHPFADGNGRMGRFLAKRLLDVEVMFPFPLFRDRTQYIGILERRCADDVNDAPSKLMEIMLRNAVHHYRKLLHRSATYDFFICGIEVDDIRHEMKKSLPYVTKKEVRTVVQAFQEMDEGGIKDIQLDKKSIRVKKFPSFIIDDI